jgi:hypothetical protein
MCNREWTVKVFAAVVAVLICTGSALAQGGHVLPACATPHGYSLSHMATETAVYNTGIIADNPLTPPPPEVDGVTTILDDDYIRSVRTPPLLDGGGDEYIVCAAFLTPLTPGEHTVGVGGIVNGEPVVFLSYNVTVR